MKSLKYITPLLLTLVFLACKSTDKTAKVDNDKGEVVASLKRTACYGTCPTYEIKVYSSGYCTFEGKRHVENVGLFEGKVSKEKVKAIMDKASAIKYFEMNDEYRGTIQDFPSCITYVKMDGKEKSIVSRHEMPEELVEFEKFFDKQFATVEWTKIAESTDQ